VGSSGLHFFQISLDYNISDYKYTISITIIRYGYTISNTIYGMQYTGIRLYNTRYAIYIRCTKYTIIQYTVAQYTVYGIRLHTMYSIQYIRYTVYNIHGIRYAVTVYGIQYSTVCNTNVELARMD
jgi:hypothetical protein